MISFLKIATTSSQTLYKNHSTTTEPCTPTPQNNLPHQYISLCPTQLVTPILYDLTHLRITHYTYVGHHSNVNSTTPLRRQHHTTAEGTELWSLLPKLTSRASSETTPLENSPHHYTPYHTTPRPTVPLSCYWIPHNTAARSSLPLRDPSFLYRTYPNSTGSNTLQQDPTLLSNSSQSSSTQLQTPRYYTASTGPDLCHCGITVKITTVDRINNRGGPMAPYGSH